MGSSETTREASIFDFKPFYDSLLPGAPIPTTFFLEWLLGFTEGDGSFQRASKKNSLKKRPVFTINQEEPGILFLIKKKLGFGTVIYIKETKKVSAHFRYRVYKIEHIFQLIQLFKGHLFLDKIHNRFTQWVESYNILCDGREKYPHIINKLSHLPKIEINFAKNSVNLLTLNSPWLTGFTDAEGSFYVSLTERVRYTRTRFKFALKQKHGKQVLEKIVTLVKSGTFSEKQEVIDLRASVHQRCKAKQEDILEGEDLKLDPIKNEEDLVEDEEDLVEDEEDELVSTSTSPTKDTKATKTIKGLYKVKGKKNTYVIDLTSKQDLLILRQYFDRYPFQLRSKNLVYVRWKRLFDRKRPNKKDQKAYKRYKRLVTSVGKIRYKSKKD